MNQPHWLKIRTFGSLPPSNLAMLTTATEYKPQCNFNLTASLPMSVYSILLAPIAYIQVTEIR